MIKAMFGRRDGKMEGREGDGRCILRGGNEIFPLVFG